MLQINSRKPLPTVPTLIAAMFRTQITSARPERMAVLALVVLGLLAFVNCLASEFIFDDLLFIDSRTLDFRSLNWLAPQADLPIKGRPLVGLTFVANYALGGTEPASYHLFNMLVHLACAVGLFVTVQRAMLRWDSASRNENGATDFAFACAALWMIHPLQTECVNYVSQRTESMAALFMLLALYCAIRSYETVNPSRWAVAAGAACWAGVFCKETTAVAPLLIVWFDFTFAGRPLRDVLCERWRVYAATLSSWLPLATLLCLLPRSVTVGANGGTTVLQYALNQGILIVQYLRLVFWPDALVIDYGRPGEIALFDALPAVAAVLALLGLALVSYRRFPAVGCLAITGFLLLAPTSSFLPINSEVGAERRMYLPLAAIVVLVVLGVREAMRRSWVSRKRATVHGVLLVVAVLLLGARTFERNSDYADPLKLWTQAVEANPDNARAWSWLVLESSRVDRAAAERVSAEMASRWHDDWRVQFDVAETYLGLHHNAAAASQCYRRVIELEPSHPRAQLRLVWLLAACVEDELRDGGEALRIATRLQTEFPGSPETLDALAIAQAECGEFEAAIVNAEAAIANAHATGISTVAIRQRAERYRLQQPFRFNES